MVYLLVSVGRLVNRDVIRGSPSWTDEIQCAPLTLSKSSLLVFYFLLANVSALLLRVFVSTYGQSYSGTKMSGRIFCNVTLNQLIVYLLELLHYRGHLWWCKFPANSHQCLLLSSYGFSLLSFNQKLMPMCFAFLVFFCTVSFNVYATACLKTAHQYFVNNYGSSDDFKFGEFGFGQR